MGRKSCKAWIPDLKTYRVIVSLRGMGDESLLFEEVVDALTFAVRDGFLVFYNTGEEVAIFKTWACCILVKPPNGPTEE
jgi:hypothetical protein